MRMIVSLGVLVAMMVAMMALTGSVLAQMPPMNFPMGKEKTLTDEEKAKNAQREQDYKSAIGKIPDQKPADPWGNVRDNGAQPAKPTTKTTTKGSQAGSQ
jgi:hypothetical protein